MLEKAGESALDYATFKQEYDSIPELQSIVGNFSEQGIELITATTPEDEETPAPEGGSSIDTSASRAANKFLKKV